MSCHSLLAWKISIERSPVILMGIPLCVICCFFLAAFNVFSLCLIFVNLINMFLGVFCLGVILSLGLLGLGVYFLPNCRDVLTVISWSIFSCPLFLSSSGTPMIQMLGQLTLPQRSLRLSSFLLIPFFFFPLCFIHFHHSIFHLTYLLFCLCYSIVGSLQSDFNLTYCIVHYWLAILYLFYVLVKHLLHLRNPCLHSVYL